MDLLLHELVRATEQLGSNEHDRGRPVAYFFVLFLCEIDKNATCWMLYSKKGENRRAVVGDDDLALGRLDLRARVQADANDLSE